MAKFPFYIAKRYLFSPKANNLINVISGISVGGVLLSTAALVCILSVFNGFEVFIQELFSTVDPDIRITRKDGHVFEAALPNIQSLKTVDGVAVYCEFFQEKALVRYGDKQMPVIVKGVDENYVNLTAIGEHMLDDNVFKLKDKGFYYGVIGQGVARELRASPELFKRLDLYVPRSHLSVNQVLRRPDEAFELESLSLAGVFMINQPEYDDQQVYVDKELAQHLFDYKGMITGIELKLVEGVNIERLKTFIAGELGDDFLVEDRYEQQAEFYKMMKLEKIMAYLLLAFVLVIATFNIVGTLSMLIVDKRDDIQTLSKLGADYSTIRTIFLLEGWAISIVGTLGGLIIGCSLCLLQEHWGLLKLPDGAYFIQHYPVELRLGDLLLVMSTVLTIGFVAAYYPVRYIFKRYKLLENTAV